MDEGLFSADPGQRLQAVPSVDSERKNELMKSYKPWTVKDHGALNAWIVIVGPSYGAKKKRKHPSLGSPTPSERHLVLGKVHEDFTEFTQEPSVFWRSLFGALEVAFERTKDILHIESSDYLKLTLTTNLSAEYAGDATKVTDDELIDGMPHFLELLRLCKPKVVVALTEKVYDLILLYVKMTRAGYRMTPDDPHPREIGGKKYHPRSCWLNIEGAGRMLLVSLPQHPSRAAALGGFYITSVGAYLGRRFRDVLTAEDVQTNTPLQKAG